MRKDWRELPLGDLCYVLDSQRRPITKKDRTPGSVPYYGASGVLDYVSHSIFDEPLVLVGEDGAKWGAGERSAFAITGPSWVNNHAHVIRPDRKSVIDAWLIYYLNWADLTPFVGGLTVRKLNQESLRSILIPTPPFREQERIVAALDEACEAISTGIKNTEQNLTSAREAMIAVQESCFSPEARAGWRTDRLGDLADFRNGLNYTKGSTGENVAVIGVSDFLDRAEVNTKTLSKVRINGVLAPEDVLQEGDLITVRSNGSKHLIGRTMLVSKVQEKIGHSGFTIRIRMKSNKVRPDYLAAFMRTASIRSALVASGVGASITSLSQDALASLVISYPPRERQPEVTDALQRATRDGVSLQGQFTRKLALLSELKTSLLTQAFSGELTAAAKMPSLPTPSANDNDFTTPEQVANVIAFAQRRHATYEQQLTFGHVKAQKVLHLVEAVGGVELGRLPDKNAAGPNDFKHMLAAEQWAKKNDFFEFEKEGGRYTFRRLAKYAERMSAAEAALAPIKDRLERATALVVHLDSKKAEVLATVHAAWNNLVLDNQEPTDEAIVRMARDEWHPDKLRIPVSEFRHAIREIRRLDIVPDGSAKRVGKSRLL